MNFGVTESINAAGMRPGTQQSAIHTQAATPEMAAALDLVQGDAVVVLERVRTADADRWCSHATSSPRSDCSSNELATMPIDGSVYELLERHGRPVAHGVVTVAPERADKATAKRLEVKPGELLLFLRQVDYGSEGEPLLLSEERHVANAFEFSVVRRGPGRRSS